MRSSSVHWHDKPLNILWQTAVMTILKLVLYISIRQNIKDILIPSEEYEIKMYPMDYEELSGQWATPPPFRSYSSFLVSERLLGMIPIVRLMRDFRLYMLVGGMPQAVSAYLSTKSLAEVDRVKRDIIRLYDKDFIRIDPTGGGGKHLPCSRPYLLNLHVTHHVIRWLV